MIFLPNKFERYTAALRISVQSMVIKKGFKTKYLKMLKKIHQAEAIFGVKNVSPIDMNLYLNSLLLCADVKLLKTKTPFNYSVDVNGCFLINQKLLTCLILNICRHTKSINLYHKKGKIVIKCITNRRINLKIIKALNAYSFYELKSKTFIIVLDAEKTTKKPQKTEKEWDILNPFSPVNIYLT